MKDKIMLLQTQLALKAAEFNLKAQELRHSIARRELGEISEEEFRAEVSNTFHDVGNLESEAASIWRHYRNQIYPVLDQFDLFPSEGGDSPDSSQSSTIL